MTSGVSKWDDSFGDIFLDMSSRGCSKTEFCATVGISWETFMEYQRTRPAFLETVMRGTQLCQSWWEKIGRENMAEKGFNDRIWGMNMRCRFKNVPEAWVETQNVNHSGGLALTTASDDELNAKIKALLDAQSR